MGRALPPRLGVLLITASRVPAPRHTDLGPVEGSQGKAARSQLFWGTAHSLPPSGSERPPRRGGAVAPSPIPLATWPALRGITRARAWMGGPSRESGPLMGRRHDTGRGHARLRCSSGPLTPARRCACAYDVRHGVASRPPRKDLFASTSADRRMRA
jgi:hypothetical protein